MVEAQRDRNGSRAESCPQVADDVPAERHYLSVPYPVRQRIQIMERRLGVESQRQLSKTLHFSAHFALSVRWNENKRLKPQSAQRLQRKNNTAKSGSRICVPLAPNGGTEPRRAEDSSHPFVLLVSFCSKPPGTHAERRR